MTIQSQLTIFEYFYIALFVILLKMKIKFYTFISKKLIHCNKSNEIIFL